MSVTMAAVLKKLAVAAFTDRKFLKTIGGIVLGLIIIVMMPVYALMSLFNGNVSIDTDRLIQIIEENQTIENLEQVQMLDATMNGIEMQLIDAGLPLERVQEAQMLYMLALEECSADTGFVEKLVGCFETEQTDAQLIEKVNLTFGKQIDVKEFEDAMKDIRNAYEMASVSLSV